MIIRPKIVVAFFLLAVPLTAIADQAPCELAKLLASDGAVDDFFGRSVSISGDYAIVGSTGDDDAGEASGSAWVFQRDDVSWIEVAKLTAGDGEAGDGFGYSVAISSDYAFVGATGDDDLGESSGSAYVFRRQGASWIEMVKLTAGDGGEKEHFGCSVSISGASAVIGAYAGTSPATSPGAAYVFTLDGSSWIEEAKLAASDGAAEDHFGCSVSLFGDGAVVGAYGDDDAGNLTGSAYVFRRQGTIWTEEAKLTASDMDAAQYFGTSVSLSGDCAVVGAHGNDNPVTLCGAAYIFQRAGTVWTEESRLTASDAGDDEHFGKSVSIDGDRALIGALQDDDAGEYSGSAYVFKRSGTTWIEEAKIVAGDGAEYDYFGGSVFISGDHAVVGAHYDDDAGSRSGSAYVYGLADKACGTVIAGMTCVPAAGALPFTSKVCLTLSNTADYSRTFAGRIDLELANGSTMPDWRYGCIEVNPNSSYRTCWNQLLPALGGLLGSNVALLQVMDVTPPPFNQPPYPPSGNTDQDYCLVAAVTGDVILIPGEYPTIQAGIDAAGAGTTVMVADGSYSGIGNRDLDFHGKAITVRSISGSGRCIIDCEQQGRGFYFHNGEGEDSVVDGFTIRNGNELRGGGISCEYSSPTITGNLIKGNNATRSGGGISCFHSFSTITRNTITDNTAQNGGGIYSNSSDLTISDNTISGNLADWGDDGGGGVCCVGEGAVSIVNNRITGNIAVGADNTGGSGIACFITSATIADNIVSGNWASGYDRIFGGGIYCWTSSLGVIANNEITGNRVLCNADGFGGGIRCRGPVVITNNTISGNMAQTAGGGISFSNATAAIENTILSFNSAPTGKEMSLGGATSPTDVSISFSDVDGGQGSVEIDPGHTLDWGPGMIDADPLFVSGSLGSYYLSQLAAGQPVDSPCVDAGNPASEMIEGTTRTDNVPDSGVVDMGFHRIR
jgi:hypothetical protein